MVRPMLDVQPKSLPSAEPSRFSSRYRADIQGLRGISVGLVLLWHAGFDWIPAGYVGVDAFFVISGFLITGILIRERARTGSVSLPMFYARRAKRLLPASAFMIFSTVILTLLLVPRIRWSGIAEDAIGSALYFQNWRLSSQAVDYLAQEDVASPFQHFWSLAVEEQFYLIWPILILLATPAGSMRRGRLFHQLAIAATCVFGFSLAWSIYYSEESPGQAYFVTTTRAWEFAIGSLVALYVLAGRMPAAPRARPAMQGLGLAALVGSALFLPQNTPFPGWIALIPTLATAAALIGGEPADQSSGSHLRASRGASKILEASPLVFVGTLSYSLYLWHWPLLVVADAAWGPNPLWLKACIAAGSIVPAYLTLRLIENPFRFRNSQNGARSGLLVGASCTAIGVASGILLLQAAPTVSSGSERAEAILSEVETQVSDPLEDPEATGIMPEASPDPGSADSTTDPAAAVGALSLEQETGGAENPQVPTVEDIIPDPLAARKDRGAFISCRSSYEATEPEDCVFGQQDSAHRVVLVGDSHANQWATAINTIAESRGWSFRILTKAACTYTGLDILRDAEYEECIAWNERVHAIILDEAPDLVVFTGREARISVEGETLSLEDGRPYLVEDNKIRWTELIQNGTQVVALADSPIPGFDVAECVSENRDDLRECTFGRTSATRRLGISSREAAAAVDGADFIDLTDSICPSEECPVVVGGVLVYRDSQHLTDSYVRTLTPALRAELDRVQAVEGD